MEKSFKNWLKKHKLSEKNYYLVVGRFVPENNYETMIREYMKSKTTKPLVLVTKPDGKFYEKLKTIINFDKDDRIKFVGTVYDTNLLKEIRGGAYAYLHGHELGGTNPSLLEALACTDLNLLLDVPFNKEVGEDGALYWNKTPGNLAVLIERANSMSEVEIAQFGRLAHERIKTSYSWGFIRDEYESLFLQA